jgi:hypothetical protein
MASRLSVTLEDQDEIIVRDFSRAGSPERLALEEWAADHGFGGDGVRSDAALLRALLRAGAEALRARTLDTGYAALALSYSPGEAAETRAARRAYVDRTESSAGA